MVARGLAENRTRAQALILAGKIFSDSRRLDKAGQMVPADTALRLKGRDHPWVSRGGVKVQHGLDAFDFDPTGAVALDIGASTGGFVDVLLHRGAAKVYAVDVGHGQLDWKLRNDRRVVVMERTNARHLSAASVPESIDFLTCDASFIGLRTVLPAALNLVRPGGRLVALIKPQFEVGPEQVGKGGVVRDATLHAWSCDLIRTWLDGRDGWRVVGIDESPITGPEGNKEFLVGAVRDD